MRYPLAHALVLGIAVLAAPSSSTVHSAAGAMDAAQAQTAPRAPESIRLEHEAIHEALVALTREPGRVGTEAQALAAVLHPHFEREEEIALPPLGLLAPLAAGQTPDGLDAARIMADTLRKEMPRMLEEHTAIRAATDALLQAGREEQHRAARQFAAELALHAQTEEEVLYPAAILVGDVIRARGARR